mgnify:CR=1 FL=1
MTKRVARFRHTIKHPVTFGSKVPLCPVFSTFNIFLIQATISWEEGFAGLSKFITPYLRCSSKGRCVGELPAFIGVYLYDRTNNLSKFFNKRGHFDVSILASLFSGFIVYSSDF